jgi:excisionase family DNA binding protein
MVPDPARKPTLSVGEAADLLGICRSTLYRAIKDGEIPVIRIGRRYRVPTARLAQLLESEER